MTERIPRRKINPVYIHEGFLFRLVKLCQDKSELLYCSERQTSIGCTASAKRINDVITVTRAHHGHEPNDEVAKAKFIRYNIRMSAESSMPPRDLISEANTSFGEESVSMAGSLDSLNRMIRRARQEGPPHMVTAAAADKTNTNNSDNHNQNDESKEDANSTTMSEVELKVVNGRVCLLLKNDLPISDFLTIMQAGESTPDLINELPPTTPIFNICEAYLIRPNLTKKLLEHDDFTPWHKGGLKKLSERHEIHNYRSEGNGIFVPCRKKCEATHFLKIQFNTLVACPSLNRKIFRMVSVEDPESHVLPSLIVYTFIGGDHPIPQQKRRSDLFLSEIVPKIAKMSPNLSLEAMLNGDFQGLLNSNIEIIGDEEKRSLENPTTSGLIEPKMETIEAEESGESDVQNDFSQQIVPTITDNHQSLFTGQSQLPPFPTTDSILEMFSAGVLSGATVPAPFFHPIVIPIADLEENSRSCSAEEITQRNKLACLYRLVDLFRWSQGIYNHITVRVSSDPDEILINAFGQLYSEVSASSLIKVDLDGTVIDGGSTKFGVNQAGYVLHSAIHKGRPEIKCVVHLHHPSVVAVSAQKCGLLPISQEAMIVGEVAYHEYSGILLDEAERELLVRDLGDRHVMILRNHGFVVCGESIEHALSQTYHLIIACETQVKTVPGGNTDNVHFPPESAIKQVYKVASQGGGGVNRQNGHVNSTQWRRGELEWQAYMRQLDAQGLNTGHVYTN